MSKSFIPHSVISLRIPGKSISESGIYKKLLKIRTIRIELDLGSLSVLYTAALVGFFRA